MIAHYSEKGNIQIAVILGRHDEARRRRASRYASFTRETGTFCTLFLGLLAVDEALAPKVESERQAKTSRYVRARRLSAYYGLRGVGGDGRTPPSEGKCNCVKRTHRISRALAKVVFLSCYAS